VFYVTAIHVASKKAGGIGQKELLLSSFRYIGSWHSILLLPLLFPCQLICRAMQDRACQLHSLEVDAVLYWYGPVGFMRLVVMDAPYNIGWRHRRRDNGNRGHLDKPLAGLLASS
jgi:hypothetical protein